MKDTTYKPTKVIDGYISKKQLHGGFKVIQLYHYEKNGKPLSEMRRRVIRKGLNMDEAEELIYKLEKQD